LSQAGPDPMSFLTGQLPMREKFKVTSGSGPDVISDSQLLNPFKINGLDTRFPKPPRRTPKMPPFLREVLGRPFFWVTGAPTKKAQHPKITGSFSPTPGSRPVPPNPSAGRNPQKSWPRIPTTSPRGQGQRSGAPSSVSSPLVGDFPNSQAPP